jgi:uncharacterized DUF497 family protein
VADLGFEWDEWKNARNRREHGVSFEEAKTAFYDEHALLIPDPDHSEDEERFILVGLSGALRTLLVSHCYRKGGDVIRIISARRADPQERKQYYIRWTQ